MTEYENVTVYPLEGTLKDRLARKPRKLIATVDIDGDAVELRRPTQGERLDVIDAAKEAGEVDADGNAVGPAGGLRLLYRLFAAVAHDPATGKRLYDPASPGDLADIADAPWLEDVQDQVAKAFNPNMEEARKNS